MRIELGRLHSELGATMVYVTHDQTEAMTMANRIVVMQGGLVEQIGSPLELYNRPSNRFVAGFLGSPRMNFIQATVKSVDARRVSVSAPGLAGNLPVPLAEGAVAPAAGDTVFVGIRPVSFVDTTDNGWTISGKVAVIESLGRKTLVFLDGGQARATDSESQEGYFAVHRAQQFHVATGNSMTVGIDPEMVFLFGPDERAIAFPRSPSTKL